MKEREKTKEQLLRELEEMETKIAECKRREKELKKAEERLRRDTVDYEKISALDRMTSNIAHEIRNPITVLGGLARRMKKSASLKGEAKEYLDLIVLEAEKLESTLEDVLYFSSRNICHREENNVKELVLEELNDFKTAFAERSIKVRKSFNNVPSIYTDRRQSGEAIRHVISNAVDAMPDGGVLTVALHKESVDGKKFVTLKVSDTGAGIPDDSVGRIFEPFFSTKVAKKETGLGLSITRKIVEENGGLLKVESKVGKGSTFSLFYPYRSE